ncbi:MAG: hypothetical protein C5B52_02950 [Bacteroidetes bacterium]|nr:MAG: hypothetical protein C5B52_02950 [Bacteroidota bacterium]
MNQKLPYEQMIADKLQHLPLPDADESWQDMKKMLDKEMPPGGGSGRNGFSPRKWWWMGAAFIMLLGIVVTKVYLKSGDKILNLSSGLASTNSGKSNEENNNLSNSSASNKNSKKTIDQKYTLNNQNSSSSSDNTIHNGPDKKSLIEETKKANAPANSVDNSNSKSLNKDATESSVSPISTGSIDNSHAKEANSPVLKSTKNSNKAGNNSAAKNTVVGTGLASAKTGTYGSGSGAKSGTGNGSSKNSGSANNYDSKKNGNSIAESKNQPGEENLNRSVTSSSSKNYKGKNGRKNKNGVDAGAAYVYSKSYQDYEVNKLENSADAQTIRYTNQQDWKKWGMYSDYTKIDEAAIPYAPNGANAKATGKLSKKDVEKQFRAEARKEKHEERVANRKPFFGEKTDRWFAAGLAPYQNFAIGPQEAYNYNSSANKGIATDYIPAPYLQFHLTDKVYVLGEFQFNNPQATSSVLLSQKNYYNPGQDPYQQNVYLRKLYYFNMPLSIYYSPIKNVYVGSGLQFSSLNSGIAYMEQVNQSNQLLYSETFKIKEDSLAAKLTGSEFRYLFDANYYWKRFMFGFRYNQALGDYINTQVNNTTSKAKNQAFALYFRYNILVSGRKGSQYDPMKY